MSVVLLALNPLFCCVEQVGGGFVCVCTETRVIMRKNNAAVIALRPRLRFCRDQLILLNHLSIVEFSTGVFNPQDSVWFPDLRRHVCSNAACVNVCIVLIAILRGRHCKVEEHIDAWEACVVYFRRPLKNTTDAGGAAAGTPFMSGFG